MSSLGFGSGSSASPSASRTSSASMVSPNVPFSLARPPLAPFP